METLSALRDAVARSPRAGEAWFQLGLALERRAEYAEALAALRAAVAANPREPQYHVVLGHILALRRAAYEDAAESCERALALDAGQWKAASLLAWLYGTVLGRRSVARPFAARALEANPDARPPYIHLCRAWLDGDPAETTLRAEHVPDAGVADGRLWPDRRRRSRTFPQARCTPRPAPRTVQRPPRRRRTGGSPVVRSC